MMLSFGLLAVALLLVSGVSSAQPPISDNPAAVARAEALAAQIRAAEIKPFAPTTHPEAAWFPRAGLGLFMHWGIHTVAGAQPSWAMIKDYPYGGRADLYPPESYYALAPQFNPQGYDPDKWLAIARKAGFTYAVLTTKHHDGYALWPSAYGQLNTGRTLGGRDLLQPYVEACRRQGLKVGFYFSPRDWSYPGYPMFMEHARRGEPWPIPDPEDNRRQFERFYEYTIGQMHELLTQYGKIDVLWFDGMGWAGIRDIYTPQTLAWIRSLQPGIVLNDRWGGAGDYHTPEWNMPAGPPEGWWENCIAWNGHWGYNPEGRFQANAWVLERLATARSWGGNFLLNVGPDPQGDMPPGYYERCAELTAWMEHSGVSVGEVEPLRLWQALSPVPITRREGTWYLHLPPRHQGPVVLKGLPAPRSATWLRTGQAVPWEVAGADLRLNPPADQRTALNDVIAVKWDKEPLPALPGQTLAAPKPGLAVEVYEGRIEKLPQLEKLTPTRKLTAAAINLEPGGEMPAFALRFRGWLQVPVAGEYTFSLTSDDGSALQIGGLGLIDNDGLHGPVTRRGTVPLTAGWHPLVVSYFQAGGGAELQVEWEGPGLPRQPLPPGALAQP